MSFGYRVEELYEEVRGEARVGRYTDSIRAICKTCIAEAKHDCRQNGQRFKELVWVKFRP